MQQPNYTKQKQSYTSILAPSSCWSHVVFYLVNRRQAAEWAGPCSAVLRGNRTPPGNRRRAEHPRRRLCVMEVGSLVVGRPSPYPALHACCAAAWQYLACARRRCCLVDRFGSPITTSPESESIDERRDLSSWSRCSLPIDPAHDAATPAAMHLASPFAGTLAYCGLQYGFVNEAPLSQGSTTQLARRMSPSLGHRHRIRQRTPSSHHHSAPPTIVPN